MSKVASPLYASAMYMAELSAVAVPGLLLSCVVSVLMKLELMNLGMSRGHAATSADVLGFGLLAAVCALWFLRDAVRLTDWDWNVLFRPWFVGMVFNFYLGLAICSRRVFDDLLGLQPSLSIALAFCACVLISSAWCWFLLQVRFAQVLDVT
ncbi:hypothetical protein [Silvimonas soli]|uniref:hypothetical protein n=1 Tax=Silvimonas soli TaxID=2980100 RepID=UPI0024B372BA|nr:hypothetical protein [Silvimonas soli]